MVLAKLSKAALPIEAVSAEMVFKRFATNRTTNGCSERAATVERSLAGDRGATVIRQVSLLETTSDSIGGAGHRGWSPHRCFDRHVAGEAGSPIYSIIGGNRELIGISSPLQLSRATFTELYPGWPGENVFVDLDIGLIDIADLNRWTTQVYGIGEIGEIADLDASNLTLRIIGFPVRAFGAASREMLGEVCALFYRIKSVVDLNMYRIC